MCKESALASVAPAIYQSSSVAPSPDGILARPSKVNTMMRQPWPFVLAYLGTSDGMGLNDAVTQILNHQFHLVAALGHLGLGLLMGEPK